jgi:agmatinase
MTPLEELTALLRPAAGGLYLVSTGREEQLALQRTLYGATTDAEVDERWRAALARIATARAVVLGIPSDVGAGFLRGANQGPQAIRSAMLRARGDLGAWMRDRGVVDAGDVFVVPQLLHDDMLSERQKAASRAALYPQVEEPTRSALPVSPLSIAERALDLIFALNPRIKPLVLGGDHSCAWPVTAALSRARGEGLGIVQSDAHTDLLSERLGIRYCFATWSFHASALLGGGGRMVQVGIRATRHPRAHWETTTGVVQHWAEACNADPDKTIEQIVSHLRSVGVRSIYFSNDIDGTDESFADATGTPEPKGLSPEFLVALVRRLGREFDVIAGDVMEVAPAIQRTEGGAERTTALAARYVFETLAAFEGGGARS